MCVDALQHLRIPLIGFLLELNVGVDLVAFGLENPAEGFGIHVVDIIFVEFERVGLVLEDLIIVYF